MILRYTSIVDTEYGFSLIGTWQALECQKSYLSPEKSNEWRVAEKWGSRREPSFQPHFPKPIKMQPSSADVSLRTRPSNDRPAYLISEIREQNIFTARYSSQI